MDPAFPELLMSGRKAGKRQTQHVLSLLFHETKPEEQLLLRDFPARTSNFLREHQTTVGNSALYRSSARHNLSKFDRDLQIHRT